MGITLHSFSAKKPHFDVAAPFYTFFKDIILNFNWFLTFFATQFFCEKVFAETLSLHKCLHFFFVDSPGLFVFQRPNLLFLQEQIVLEHKL